VSDKAKQARALAACFRISPEVSFTAVHSDRQGVLTGEALVMTAQALDQWADRPENKRPTEAQLDAIWERLATSIEARAVCRDSTVIRDLSRVGPEHRREIAQIAINLVVRLQEGRLP
jgi:hypothetical protein